MHRTRHTKQNIILKNKKLKYLFEFLLKNVFTYEVLILGVNMLLYTEKFVLKTHTTSFRLRGRKKKSRNCSSSNSYCYRVFY